MDILFAIILMAGILSGVWGWMTIAFSLLNWAGFLGCAIYFACPQGGLKGLAIFSYTVMSGVVWILIIIHGSALALQLQALNYMMTGTVAFLMCIQARQTLLSFISGTFAGAYATFAADDDWRLMVPFLALGLIFGYAMKNSGLWLTARTGEHKSFVNSNARLAKQQTQQDPQGPVSFSLPSPGLRDNLAPGSGSALVSAGSRIHVLCRQEEEWLSNLR